MWTLKERWGPSLFSRLKLPAGSPGSENQLRVQTGLLSLKLTSSLFTLVPPPPPAPQSWDVFFRNANAGAPPGAAYQSPLGLSAAPQLSSLVGAQPNVEKLVEDHLAVQSLIRAYQVHTHTHTLIMTCRR